MEQFFSPPDYHTPAAQRARWNYRFLPGTTFMLLADLVRNNMLPARKLALKDELTPEDVAARCTFFTHQCEKTGVKFHITGLDHLAESRDPCVFVCNHMSTLETFILPGIIHPFKPVTFVIKESILRQRMFGPIIKVMDPIAVTREDPKADLKKVLSEGMATLKAGKSLVIFPQTTRTPTFDPAQFNTLGEKLAKRAGVPIIPVAVKTDFWSPGRLIKDLGKIIPDNDVYISFDKPMDSSINPKHLHQAIVDTIAGKLKSWGTTVLQPGDSK